MTNKQTYAVWYDNGTGYYEADKLYEASSSAEALRLAGGKLTAWSWPWRLVAGGSLRISRSITKRVTTESWEKNPNINPDFIIGETKMIITHTNPDLDAITGVWLLKKFGGLKNEPVLFVNTGNPDPDKLAQAVAVVDTGRTLDIDGLRFDHHHLPGQAANDTCAAKQVYDYLLENNPDLEYLSPLINLVFAGDTGRSEANASRELGLHAILSGYKAWFSEQNPDTRLADDVILAYGFGLLDVLEVRLRHQAEAKAELEEKVVYKSDDGLVWAIKYGSTGSTFAAYDAGARVVLFEGEPLEVEGGTTYPIGIMRAGEWQEPHVGKLAEDVQREAFNYHDVDVNNIGFELETWFKHPAGFFAGRGTAKAPVFEPGQIDLAMLAKLVDVYWVRK